MEDSLSEDVASWLRLRDETAARRLVDALYPTVIRIVQNHLPRRMEPEDLAQDVFVQFFRTLDRYEPRRPLQHWVSRMALNVCLKALRSRRRRPEWRWSDLGEGEQALAESLLQEADTPLESAADGRELLGRLLDELSPRDRMILTMLHLEEKPVAEVADLMGWNATLVRVSAFRARAKLRQALEALERRRRGPAA